jgi:hypothetical protein
MQTLKRKITLVPQAVRNQRSTETWLQRVERIEKELLFGKRELVITAWDGTDLDFYLAYRGL